MSLSEGSSVVFAYVSSVHSANVLLSLDEQRKQDLFCDVTILVEDQRFRAHRSVLAACSSYFRSRIVGQMKSDVIILPEEITLKGFDPLLQFAYTSKLILDKDNVDEVCKCAEFLEIHDIEESCFQFLKFKFLDHNPDHPEYPKKKCCKSRCQKEDHPIDVVDDGDLEIDEMDTNVHNACGQDSPSRACNGEQNTELLDNQRQTCEPVSQKDLEFDLASLCPKYRKFQKALESDDKVPSVQCNSSIKEIQVPSAASIHQTELLISDIVQKSLERAIEQPVCKCEGTQVDMEEDGGKETTSVLQDMDCPSEMSDSAIAPHSSATTHGLYSAPFLNVYDQYCDLSGIQSQTEVAGKNCVVTGTANSKTANESADEGLPLKAHLCDRDNVNDASPTNRSSVEREVAEHLAQGFWSDIYSTDRTCQVNVSPASGKEFSEQADKKTECPWLGIRISDSPEDYPQRTFTTLSSVNCPFINNLASENSIEINSGECAQEQQQEQYPYTCVVSLEEDSETDTEGDSESCSAREQECEVKLPFNAQKIISLSRNDFQSFLQMHKLTPEQLDCIHDIRRRSKNRIAAQRCRKRKLDCIQNLESEIEKLQDERESLLKEKDHILSTLVETKQNLTGLCQQVCKEAALSHEQIQILAKYSTTDCPLSFLIPEREQPTPSDALSAIPLRVELSADLSVASTNEQNCSYQHVKDASDIRCNQAQEFL